MNAWIYISCLVVAIVSVAVLLVSLSIIVVSPVTRGAMFHPSATMHDDPIYYYEKEAGVRGEE